MGGSQDAGTVNPPYVRPLLILWGGRRELGGGGWGGPCSDAEQDVVMSYNNDRITCQVSKQVDMHGLLIMFEAVAFFFLQPMKRQTSLLSGMS